MQQERTIAPARLRPWLIVTLIACASAVAAFYPGWWFTGIAIGGLLLNTIVFVRALLGLVDRRDERKAPWVVIALLTFLHVFGCGGAFAVLQVLWSAELPE